MSLDLRIAQSMIYIIEDDLDFGPFIEELLLDAGYSRVRLFQDGLDGLNACFAQAPDLVVLDLNLPSMEGQEICRVLRSFPDHASIPIVICSSIPDPKRWELEMLRIGADHYLEKPFVETNFLETIERLLRRAKGIPAPAVEAPAPPPSPAIFPSPPAELLKAPTEVYVMSGREWDEVDIPKKIPPAPVPPVLQQTEPVMEKADVDAPEHISAQQESSSGLDNATSSSSRSRTSEATSESNESKEENAPGRREGELYHGYKMLAVIGGGARGTVERALQGSLDRIVALKVLLRAREDTADAVERFLREARIMAQLNHPNVVQIHDAGNTGHTFFIAMEWVEGGSLLRQLQAGAMALPRLRSIIQQSCDALTYLHNKGVIHGDIKPANIFVSADGVVKLGDFGISRAVRPTFKEELRRIEALIMGTPAFMAPELYQSVPANERSDQFALAHTFWSLFTRSNPPHGNVPPLHVACPNIPATVSWVIHRASHSDAAQRYASIREFKEALLAALPEDFSITTNPSTPPVSN